MKKSLEVPVGLTLQTLAHVHTPHQFSVNYLFHAVEFLIHQLL